MHANRSGSRIDACFRFVPRPVRPRMLRLQVKIPRLHRYGTTECNRPGARRTMPSITTPSPRAHEDLRQHFSILNTDELDAAGPVGAGDEAGDEGALITRLIRSLVKLTGGGMCELPRDPRRPSPKHAALVWTACGDSTPVRRGLSTRSPYRSGSMARSVRWHDLKCWRTNDPWNRPQHPARNRSPVHDLAAR